MTLYGIRYLPSVDVNNSTTVINTRPTIINQDYTVNNIDDDIKCNVINVNNTYYNGHEFVNQQYEIIDHFNSGYSKQLEGYGVIEGTIFEKVDTSPYNTIKEFELYDARSSFRYGKYPIVDGSFKISGVAHNDYEMFLRDPSNKYNGKIVKFVVDKDNVDLIKPMLIPRESSVLLTGHSYFFKQRIDVSGCIGGELTSVNITNRPQWLNLVKSLDGSYYIASGNVPSNLLNTTLSLEYNLLDYRPNNVVETYTISYTKNLIPSGFKVLFDDLTKNDFAIVGDVRLTEYNGMKGLSVNGKTKCVTIPNSTVPITTNSYTIMFAFTINNIDPLGSTNMFVTSSASKTSTSTTNTFFIGTSEVTKFGNIRLRYRISNVLVPTEVTIVPKETYFVKFVVSEGIVSLWVNGRVVHTSKTTDTFPTDVRDLLFGDGYWGDRRSDITIHEYNFFPNYADISNEIKFDCTQNGLITSFESDKTLIYNFATSGLSAKYTEYEDVNKKLSLGYYTPNLIDNALFDRKSLSINAINSYTINLSVTPIGHNYTQTLLSLGRIKLQLIGNLIEVRSNIELLYAFNVTFNIKITITVIVNGNKATLYINGNTTAVFDVTNDIHFDSNEYIDVSIGCDGNADWYAKQNLSKSKIHQVLIRDKIGSIGNHTPLWYTPITSISNHRNKFSQPTITHESPILIANDNVFEPVLHTSGVTVDDDGSYTFTSGTDRLAFHIPEISDPLAVMEMSFDFYWSGLRTGNSSTDSILYMLDSLNQTTITNTTSRSNFTIRCDGTGKNPKVRVFYENLIGSISSTSQTLQVGWNTIRCFKQSEYHFGYYLNDTLIYSTNYHSSYTSSFGTGGYVNFGYNDITKVGLVGCKIRNFKLAVSDYIA